MRAAAVSLCASLRPSVFNTAILTAGEKKKKKDKKEKKLLSPPISACADPTACCKIPSLSKLQYPLFRDTKRAGQQRCFQCSHVLNIWSIYHTNVSHLQKSRENDFLAGQPFIQQNAYVLFVRYISRTCDSVISLKFWWFSKMWTSSIWAIPVCIYRGYKQPQKYTE